MARVAALAHINLAVEIRQFGQRRVFPHDHAGLVRPLAGNRHDAKPGGDGLAQACQAGTGEDIFPIQARRAQRGHGKTVIDTALAIGDERHRPIRLETGRRAVHPDDFLRAAMAGVGLRRHRQPDQDIDFAAAQLARQRIEIVGAHAEAHVRPALTELRQSVGQGRGDEIARGADADHQFGTRAAAPDMHDLIVEREQAAGVTDDQFALRRRAHPGRAAVK